MRSPACPMFIAALTTLSMAVVGCNAYPVTPTDPAYDLVVRPVLVAHCARCHGAGGTLNVPTEPTGPGAPTIPSVAGLESTFVAYNLYVTQFDDTNCMPDSSGNIPADCKKGAAGYAQIIASSVAPSAMPPVSMPPAPAPRLNDWEVGILQNWAKNPICSNSAIPDRSICPNGPGQAM